MGIIEDQLKEINKAIEGASKSLDDLNRKALDGGVGFIEIASSIRSATSATTGFVSKLGELGSKMTLGLDLGVISGSLDFLSNTMNTVINSSIEAALVMDTFGKGIDSVTGYSRALNSTMYKTVASFGEGYESAKQYAEYMISSATKFATAEFGFMTPGDRIKALESMSAAGISLGNISSVVETAAGKMDLLNVAFLQSKALGMELSTYSKILSDSIMRQGLTTQQAAEQMSMFGDISQNTGLRVDRVAEGLQSTANNFSKLGLSAAFGKPILEGFSSTLSGMGMGLENAIDLSGTLSSALVGLTSNYSAAYLTFQKGGLDMGGGSGALGAGIGLRAKMADSTPEDQGKIGMELAKGMRDTLASFTGGQTVTVQQAAEDPKLQAAFFTQTKLLEQLYGIQDAGAQDRTLDLLSQIDTAMKSGDMELAESLGKDLQEAGKLQNETLGYQAKIEAHTAAALGELQLLNTQIVASANASGTTLSDALSRVQSGALSAATPAIAAANSQVPDGPMVDFNAGMDKVSTTISSSLSGMSETLSNMDPKIFGSAVAEALSKTGVGLSSGSEELMIRFISTSSDLIGSIKKLINERV